MRKQIRVIKIQHRPRVSDYSRAAAMTSPVMNHADDDPWLGYAPGEPGYPTPGYEDEPWLGGSNSQPTNQTQKKGFWDVLGTGIEKFGNALTKGKADSSAGKSGAIDILAGLSEDYIRTVVAKYKNGESLSEFERRVAIAALKAESFAKNKAKEKAGAWVMDHLPEIGLGVLGLIVLLTFITRR